MQNWSNEHRIRFKSTYDGNPILHPEQYEPVENWISIKDVLSYKGDKSKTGVHFFNDDYRFERVYTYPKKWIIELKQFACVATPDFSLYTDFPIPISKYNHFRKHWCGALWQKYGLKVYPSIGWMLPDSYRWCFDGDPVGGTVIISNVGVSKDKDARASFLQGFYEMKKRLKPTTILLLGSEMKELEKENIVFIKTNVNESIRQWREHNQ